MIGLYLIFIACIYLSPYMLSDIWGHYILTYGCESIIVRVCIPWILSLIVYWAYGTFWLLIDYYQITIFARLQPIKTNRTNSVLNCVKVVLINQVGVLLPTIYILDYGSQIDFSIELPSATEIFIQLIQVFIAGEIFYYYMHRCLHHKLIYRHIHKIHHEYITPIGIASLYCHPIEMLVGNTLTLIGPLYLFNVHGYVLYLGIILGFFESVADHAGYDTKGNFHDKHHELFNCNYGTFKFLDYLHGTLIE